MKEIIKRIQSEREYCENLTLNGDFDLSIFMDEGINTKFRAEIGDKKYIYKVGEIYSTYNMGEFITSLICEKLGVNCVKSMPYYNLATNNRNDMGALIEYFKKPENEYISLTSMLVDLNIDLLKLEELPDCNKLLKQIKLFAKDNNLIVDKNLDDDLKTLALMDYLLMQTDRHTSNIEFEIVSINGKRVLKLAPMFDNEMCLYFTTSERMQKIMETELESEFTFINSKYSNPVPVFKIDKKSNQIKDLAHEVMTNKKLQKVFLGFAELNMAYILKIAESFIGFEIEPKLKKIILKGVHYRKLALLNEMKSLKIKLARSEDEDGKQ